MTWRPESPAAAYPWLAAFGGHLAVGVALWLAFAWLPPVWACVAASLAYALLWEGVSAYRYGLMLMDSILDTVGVTFGALTAAGLWQQSWPLAAWCCASCLVIAYAGWRRRTDHPSDNGD